VTKKLDTKIKLSAHQVLAALRDKMFAGDAWAWLTEVRNGTGYQRTTRSADALAVSCWPSRGLFASGVEVKVSRSDWKHELLQPAKSDEVQRFCKFWWIATSPGIVLHEELPPAWGLVETDGKTCSVIRAAPELEHREPTWLFLASVLRNASKTNEGALARARADGYKSGSEKADAIIAEHQTEFRELRRMEMLKARAQELEAQIESFRELTGIQVGGWHDRDAAKAIKAAKLLQDADLERLSKELQHNLAALTAASEAVGALADIAVRKSEAAE